jgi:hypothetical protein
MDQKDLPLYGGPQTACCHCGREFRPGEILSVTNGGALAFCHTPGNKGCLIDYIRFELPTGPRTLVGHAFNVFREHPGTDTVVAPAADGKPSLVERMRRLFEESTD